MEVPVEELVWVAAKAAHAHPCSCLTNQDTCCKSAACLSLEKAAQEGTAAHAGVGVSGNQICHLTHSGRPNCCTSSWRFRSTYWSMARSVWPIASSVHCALISFTNDPCKTCLSYSCWWIQISTSVHRALISVTHDPCKTCLSCFCWWIHFSTSVHRALISFTHDPC